MKLTKYIFSAAIILSGALLTSCNNWLEEKPESFIGPESIGDSEAAASRWVAGVYSNWLDDMFRWSNFPRVLELDADYISGPDWLFGNLGAGNFQGDDTCNSLWSGCYNLINDANTAIRYVSAMSSISDAVKNNALGELYFQKAFAYFLLVRAYGAIPYFESDVASGVEYYQPRMAVADVYGKITDLLTQAAGMMYKNTDSGFNTGHVSAGSAAGLLAKVYATMASGAMPADTEIQIRTGEPFTGTTYKDAEGNETFKEFRSPTPETFNKTVVAGHESMNAQELYEKAAEWAKKVIDGEYGSYELSSYDNLWKKSNRDASEFMWAVRSNNGDQVYCTHIHTYYSGYKTSASSEFIGSGGWVGCTNNWYELFDSQDYRITKGVRHTWRYYYQESYDGCFYYPLSWKVRITGSDLTNTYVQEPDPEYAATGYNYQYNQSSECLAFTTKYNDVEDEATDYADSQWPFLRYADVLLIYAEAENELGNSTEAMTYLNQVRQRSNATLMTTYQGKMKMRSAILEERAKEFACEGDRRWDLIRWGVYLDAMNAIGGRDEANIVKTREKRHLLYPIPTVEMNVNKAITENNPGWN